MACGGLFYSQSPLFFASANGHTAIVAMLLQVKGIDVNKRVRIATLTTTLPLLLTLIFFYVYVCPCPSTDVYQHPSPGSLILWWHRDSGHVATSQWNRCKSNRSKYNETYSKFLSWNLNIIGVICLSSIHLHLQDCGGSPLSSASEGGQTEIVAMLLRVKGIDVNKGVSIMRPTLSMTLLRPITTNSYHYIVGMSILFPSAGTTRGSLEEGSHRDSGHVVTGQRNWRKWRGR